MWEPAVSLYTFNCQPNPTSLKLLNGDLLFSIFAAITLVQAPISSSLDYCFISYFVHIQSIFCTIAIVLWLWSLLWKNLQSPIYSTNSLLTCNRFFMFWSLLTIIISFLILLLFISYIAAIHDCFHFPGTFHEHTYTSSSANGALSAQCALMDLENTRVSLKTRLSHSLL